MDAATRSSTAAPLSPGVRIGRRRFSMPGRLIVLRDRRFHALRFGCFPSWPQPGGAALPGLWPRLQLASLAVVAYVVQLLRLRGRVRCGDFALQAAVFPESAAPLVLCCGKKKRPGNLSSTGLQLCFAAMAKHPQITSLWVCEQIK
jgi:hypothetical protein